MSFIWNSARIRLELPPDLGQGKPTKKRPHNHSFVTDSYDSRPRAFQTVGLTAWKMVIKAGRADSSAPNWRQIGRPTTLSAQEESTLAEHIKATALAGHLVTNNAIIIWALQILAESPRFLAFSSEEQQNCVSRMGGKNWLRAFKKRHGIKLKNSSKPLEIVRAQKTQPENMVDFFRNLLNSHAMAHIHGESRRSLGQAGTLNFEGVSLGLTATSLPQGKKIKPAEVLQAEICSVPGLATWQPGVADVEGDFFFRSY